MAQYWFRPKRYGWGFVPISREGWMFTILLLLVLGLSAYEHGMFNSTGQDPDLNQVAGFLVDLFLIIFASSWYMVSKMKQPLRWRWGCPDNQDE